MPPQVLIADVAKGQRRAYPKTHGWCRVRIRKCSGSDVAAESIAPSNGLSSARRRPLASSIGDHVQRIAIVAPSAMKQEVPRVGTLRPLAAPAATSFRESIMRTLRHRFPFSDPEGNTPSFKSPAQTQSHSSIVERRLHSSNHTRPCRTSSMTGVTARINQASTSSGRMRQHLRPPTRYPRRRPARSSRRIVATDTPARSAARRGSSHTRFVLSITDLLPRTADCVGHHEQRAERSTGLKP